MTVSPITRPNDLSTDSAAAIMNTMVELVREYASLEIRVTREILPGPSATLSMFVVTLPPEATQEQLAEADYWLNEVAPLFRYAGQSF